MYLRFPWSSLAFALIRAAWAGESLPTCSSLVAKETTIPTNTVRSFAHRPPHIPIGRKHVFIYRSREAVKLGCRKILLDKISSFGYSMVDESIRRPTGT